MNRIKAIMYKEFLQMKRDRLTLALAFMLPIVQLLIFGFGIQTEVKHISTIVWDQSLSHESRDLISSFTASGYFDVKYVAKSYDEISHHIDSGKAKVGIVIPSDFNKTLHRGESSSAQILIDASDNMVALQAVSIANSIGLIKNQALLQSNMPNFTPPYDIRVRSWYNPDGITAFYIVPGILGILVTMTMVILTSIGIVRERERGTLEQLMVTPIRPFELMLGKIIPYIALGYVQITVALLLAVIVFHVPIRGNLLELYILTLFFITASLGMGIAISNVAKTQLQAMQMSFFVMMPSILLSGFMFPRDAMPKIVYYIGNLIPLTFYLDIIRGIVLKGIGFSYLYGQVIALLVFSIVFIAISALKFKKTIT